jgi:hypothetical protein
VLRPVLRAVVLVAGAGCAHEHVTLNPAPSADAPRADRLAAYSSLRPVGAGDAPATNDRSAVNLPQTPGRFSFTRSTNAPSQGWRPAPGDQHSPFLDLANGTRVRYAEDLLPVIPDSSVTARHAFDEMRDERVVRSAEYLGVGSSLVAVTGFVVAYTVNRGPPSHGPDAVLVPALAAAGTGLLVGAVAAVVAAWYGRNSVEARLNAFQSYNDSLREGLGLRPEDVESAFTAYGPAP